MCESVCRGYATKDFLQLSNWIEERTKEIAWEGEKEKNEGYDVISGTSVQQNMKTDTHRF
jgi:hypothetical protein